MKEKFRNIAPSRFLSFLTLALTLVCSSATMSQVIELDRQLIGSGFSEFSNGTSFTLSASIGEPISTTDQNTDLIITQGFQQSNYVLSNPFVVSLSAGNAACIGANDGFVVIEFISTNITAPYYFQWSNGASSESISQLESGTYSVTVTGSNGKSVTNSITVGVDDNFDCTPMFYTGLTPNGDNSNDQWFIENIDFFVTKKVEIFNRYGDRVWHTNDYNNSSDFFAGNYPNGQELPDGTYYFIAEFDDSVYKGWIEITR